jgi:guanosine-3',5'-bis(diphosphate) 3'-pyrophosphohydrolase
VEAKLFEVLLFAARKHSQQTRKDAEGSPYVNHLIEVADLLARVGGVSECDVLAAAILHDSVEDVGVTPEELEKKFGKRVREIVAEVTDDKTLPKEERKRLQIEHAPHLSREAKLVKLGDKISNVREIGASPPADWEQARRLEYIDWARRVVDGCRGTNAALEKHFDEVAAETEKELTS